MSFASKRVARNLLTNPIFLDNQATTPIDPRVFDAMVPHMSRDFGNPHSTAHIYGTEQMKICDKAREQVANCINADPEEIIFMSGATEANNTVIKGISKALKHERDELITFDTEHKWTTEAVLDWKEYNMKPHILNVKRDGMIDYDDLESIIMNPNSNIALVWALAVNNETGVTHNLPKISKLCKQKGILFHSDAAQAVGKIKIDVKHMGVDFLWLTGHKFYGPKGIGALFIRKDLQKVLIPIISGGGQEKGIRSGTLAPFLLAGLGEAWELVVTEFERDKEWVTGLKDHFYKELTRDIDGITINGHTQYRYQGNLNISIRDVPSSRLIKECKEVAMSSRAACIADDFDAVPDQGSDRLRFSFGRFTTKEEVDIALEYLIKAIKKIRS